VNSNGNYRLRVYNNGSTTSRVVAGQSSWTNYSFQATLNIGANSQGSASLLARVVDNTHLYFFGYNIALGKWMIAMRNGTTSTIIATSATYAVYPNRDYTIGADLNGSSLKLYVGGVLQVSATDSTFASGKIGFTATNATALLDDVVVTAITTQTAMTQQTQSAKNTGTPTGTTQPGKHVVPTKGAAHLTQVAHRRRKGLFTEWW